MAKKPLVRAVKKKNQAKQHGISKKLSGIRLALVKGAKRVLRCILTPLAKIHWRKKAGVKAPSRGKTGRLRRMWATRRQRVALIAAAGVVIAAVILTAVLVPASAAAQERESAAQTQESTIAAASVVRSTVQPSPTPTPVPTTSPDPTPVATTSPDPVTPSPKPTEKPTPKPTEKPTPKPTEKPTPKPTEKPKPSPTPEATQKKETGSKEMSDWVAYYQIDAETYYNDVGYASNHYDYTDAELYMVAQVIDGEAGGQPWEGRVAVGNVIMNRVIGGYPGSTITAVVTAGGQFTAYHPDRVPRQTSIDAAHDVLDDEAWTVPQNTYNFKPSGTAGEPWGRHDYWGRIGGHNFYIDVYYDKGRNVSSIPPALFKRTYEWPQYGCKPEDRVKRMQLMLAALGYSVSTDAYFGHGTTDAVKAFQAANGLTADGVAGPTTIETLIKAYGEDKYYADFVG